MVMIRYSVNTRVCWATYSISCIEEELNSGPSFLCVTRAVFYIRAGWNGRLQAA